VSSDFIPIEWSIKESPALAVRAATFPPAKMVRLKAIKETAVFEGAFRLMRDVTIARDAVVKPLLDADGNLTIEGAIKYQACDEKLCYPPETIPVRWILQVGGAQTDRDKGVEDLRLTAERGRYLSPYARLLLAVAALRSKDIDRARDLLAALAREFPHNRLYAQELAQLR